jgi:uncharacterized membrane protein YccC
VTNHLRLRFAWAVLAAGVLLLSVPPIGSWLSQVVAPYLTSRWLHFLAYAALTAIPCFAWRTKKGVLFSLSVVGLCVAFELSLTIANGPAVDLERVFSDCFGIAAGILLGVNLRLSRSSAGKVADMTQADRRPTTF